MDTLRVSLIQTDIIWENKEANLKKVYCYLQDLNQSTDIAILPEMFSTGFTMQSEKFAESIYGPTITSLKKWSRQFSIAICGSFICNYMQNFYNCAFFLTPEGDEYYYHKKHLFRMGEEAEHFKPGDKPSILTYKEWNISLAICYDLRFPVWLRNVNNSYDLLIVVANWPTSRKKVWETLLTARSLENQSYICGVNRIGTDGNNLSHSGNSMLLTAKGECMTNFIENQEMIQTTSITLSALRKFRADFPVWKDADKFKLITG